MNAKQVFIGYADELIFFDLFNQKQLNNVFIKNKYFTGKEIEDYLLTSHQNIKHQFSNTFKSKKLIDISSITDIVKYENVLKNFRKKSYNDTILISHLSYKDYKFIIQFLHIYYLKTSHQQEHISEKDKETLYSKLMDKNVFFSSVIYYKDDLLVLVYNIANEIDWNVFFNKFEDAVKQLFESQTCNVCDKDHFLSLKHVMYVIKITF